MTDEPRTTDADEEIEDLDLAPDDAEDVKGGRDPATGMATGRRSHKPFTITTEGVDS